MSTDARKIRLLMHLRGSGVTDHRVLSAIERVPRELFVPAAFQDQAYEDIALPIDMGQTISQPLVVALMTQALEVMPRHRVLEVGTGSGYQAAVLARLCRRLYTIEKHKELLQQALTRFDQMRIHNVTAIAGDGTKGWPEQAPFERIIVTAAHGGEDPPRTLVEQLGTDGIMIIPMGDEKRNQKVVRLVRRSGGIERKDLFPVRFVPLLPDAPEGGTRPPRRP